MTWRDDIDSSPVLKARHINEASRELSYYINGQLVTNTDSVTYVPKSDKDTTPYSEEGIFTSRELFKPDFFGSPSPRMGADAGGGAYRSADQDWSAGAVFNPNSTGGGFTGVPGLSTSLRLR